MTSPQSKIPCQKQFRCAGAQYYHVAMFMLSKHGAKHSPPGAQGMPDCQRGDPPESVAGDPLSHVFMYQIMLESFNLKWNRYYF